MVLTRNNKKSLLQQGEKILRTKVTINKSRKVLQKAARFSLKNKDKLFSRSIVLPTSFQLTIGGNKVNSIRTVHTSTGKSIASPPIGIASGKKSDNTVTNNTIVPKVTNAAKTEEKKKKKISIKKFFRSKAKEKKESSDVVASVASPEATTETTSKALSPKNQENTAGDDLASSVALRRSNSAETADVTIDTTPTTTPSRTDEASSLPATPSTTSSSASPNHKSSPYIFTDDEHDEAEGEEAGIPQETIQRDSAQNDAIEAKLDEEMKRLDERIRDQKAGERALAQEQLSSNEAEKEKSLDESSSSSLPTPVDKKNDDENTVSFFRLLLLLIPITLLVALFTTSYNPDKTLERANVFFETSGSDKPMQGITVVVAETESKIGKVMEERFGNLGATVASIQIDCHDLTSVSESIDALLKQVDSVDFLVNTGNMCIAQNKDQTVMENMKSITSKTVQGYDALYAGNYLSSFLMTQKLLPKLEQSRFGTLVQFTSGLSMLVDGSRLKMDSASENPVVSTLLQHDVDNTVLSMMKLPVQYAYAKLSEALQHRVIARSYPNVRTMEVSDANGFISREVGINNFFYGVFEQELKDTKLPPSMIIDNEDLQDSLYEWSQNAVWKWVAPPSPSVSDMLLGRGKGVSSTSINEESSMTMITQYLPSAQTFTVVTGGALAMMAMKTSSWGPGRYWWSSE